MFTNHISTVSFSKDEWRELESSYKFIWFWLGTTISGMVFASIWQWAYDIPAASLMESPLFFRAMMVGGSVAFVVSLVNTLIVLPIWHDIREHVWPKIQRRFPWKLS